MIQRDSLIKLIQVLILILFCMSIVTKSFQNDTFFSIPSGMLIFENGIVAEEKMVWHEGLEFTNSRWLFDVLLAILNSKCGFDGIFIFVIILTIIHGLLYYFVLNKIIKKSVLSFYVTLIVMYFARDVFVARAQIVSFLLFLFEFYSIFQLLECNKKRYYIYLLIIPLILANTHASVFPMYFVFYLPYLAEFILLKIIKKDEDSKLIIEKRNIVALVVLMFLSFGISFITPNSVSPYTDMFKAMSQDATSFIQELQPINFVNGGILTLFIIAIIAIISFTKTQIRVVDAFYILGFGIMALTTDRCKFFFYFFSILCCMRIINDFIEMYNVRIDIFSNKFYVVIYILLNIYILLFSIDKFITRTTEDYVVESRYPVHATNYIKTNLDIDKMKIFNHFNFGSYLELNNIPVFIDSRSGIYTPEFNPGVTILSDWLAVHYGKIHYQTIFDKYEITHALLYNDEVINVYISNDENWKCIYSDMQFSLYERNNRK